VILEIATLDIKPGQTQAFEAAFATAQTIIAASPGYVRHELQHCLENQQRYVLLVWWTDLQSHTVGFRQSARYQQWKALLHHFYDPLPTVEHFALTIL
jgi:heme-degrading monooxygenase HmoA